jgi:hypothetical protein
MTRRSAEARVIARFTAVIVFPSPGDALVTMIDFGKPPSFPAVASTARSVRYPFQTVLGRSDLPVR